jgi:hypothetical protein
MFSALCRHLLDSQQQRQDDNDACLDNTRSERATFCTILKTLVPRERNRTLVVCENPRKARRKNLSCLGKHIQNPTQFIELAQHFPSLAGAPLSRSRENAPPTTTDND